MSGDGRYVYGLRVVGLDDVGDLDPTAAPGGPAVEVAVRQLDATPPAPAPVDGERAVLRLADGGHLAMSRRAGTATFYGPRVPSDVLAHPRLAPVATAFNRWAGREAFHAGAFVRAGRAWAVLGPRTAGKSSLLAALAARGVAILSDDIVVTDGIDAFAGPRCLDLREPLPTLLSPRAVPPDPAAGDPPAGHPAAGDPPAGHLAAGQLSPDRPARLGTRLRVSLPPLAPRIPLGGWLFLGWGAPALTPVPPDQLLGRLTPRRSWRALASDPLTLLQLGTLPAWDLIRPRDWSAVPDTLDGLLATLSTVALPPALVAPALVAPALVAPALVAPALVAPVSSVAA